MCAAEEVDLAGIDGAISNGLPSLISTSHSRSESRNCTLRSFGAVQHQQRPRELVHVLDGRRDVVDVGVLHRRAQSRRGVAGTVGRPVHDARDVDAGAKQRRILGHRLQREIAAVAEPQTPMRSGST